MRQHSTTFSLIASNIVDISNHSLVTTIGSAVYSCFILCSMGSRSSPVYIDILEENWLCDSVSVLRSCFSYVCLLVRGGGGGRWTYKPLMQGDEFVGVRTDDKHSLR